MRLVPNSNCLRSTLDGNLRGDTYPEQMGAVEGYEGWLAQAPFGFITLDRESGEFFLRSRDAMFPSMTLAALFRAWCSCPRRSPRSTRTASRSTARRPGSTA